MIEFGTPAFGVALLQIVGINIVLSGDNAVVIALAARSLPHAQQRKAVFWGSGAAVAMRIALTIVAVELLKLPVLKLIGAVLLVWIAVQLLLPDDESDGGAKVGGTLAAAIRTILIADLVMSLDNVIGVAAAAKGSTSLLIIGLAISIPLVVFASTFLLKVMERFPVIVTFGAVLLGYVAGEMAVSDPLSAAWIEANAHWLHDTLPVAGAVIVLVLGKLLKVGALGGGKQRPLTDIATGIAPPAQVQPTLKLLLPVDGADQSLSSVDRLIAMRQWYRDPIEVHLLNVQHTLHKDVGQFVASGDITDYHRDEGVRQLAAARSRLEAADLPHVHHIVVSADPAEAITQFARDRGIGQILMGSHKRSPAGQLILGSVTRDVLNLCDIPILLTR